MQRTQAATHTHARILLSELRTQPCGLLSNSELALKRKVKDVSGNVAKEIVGWLTPDQLMILKTVIGHSSSQRPSVDRLVHKTQIVLAGSLISTLFIPFILYPQNIYLLPNFLSQLLLLLTTPNNATISRKPPPNTYPPSPNRENLPRVIQLHPRQSILHNPFHPSHQSPPHFPLSRIPNTSPT